MIMRGKWDDCPGRKPGAHFPTQTGEHGSWCTLLHGTPVTTAAFETESEEQDM